MNHSNRTWNFWNMLTIVFLPQKNGEKWFECMICSLKSILVTRSLNDWGFHCQFLSHLTQLSLNRGWVCITWPCGKLPNSMLFFGGSRKPGLELPLNTLSFSILCFGLRKKTHCMFLHFDPLKTSEIRCNNTDLTNTNSVSSYPLYLCQPFIATFRRLNFADLSRRAAA